MALQWSLASRVSRCSLLARDVSDLSSSSSLQQRSLCSRSEGMGGSWSRALQAGACVSPRAKSEHFSHRQHFHSCTRSRLTPDPLMITFMSRLVERSYSHPPEQMQLITNSQLQILLATLSSMRTARSSRRARSACY